MKNGRRVFLRAIKGPVYRFSNIPNIWVTLQSCVQRLHVFSNLYNIIYALHTRKTVIVTDL